MQAQSKNLMHPVAIIHLAHQIADKYWREKRGLRYPQFASLLSEHHPNVSETDYSHLTSKGRCTRALARALCEPAVQRRIEDKLNYPGLFACKSPDEVRQLVYARAWPSVATSAAKSTDCLLAPREPPREPWVLSVREERVARHLQSMCVQEGDHQIVCWADPPSVGASFIAHVLASTYLPMLGVRNVFLVQPYTGMMGDDLAPGGRPDPTRDDGAPFDQGMQQLATNLGLSPRPDPSELLKSLHQSRGVLFILQANHLAETERADDSLLGDLLNEALRPTARRPAGAPVPIVLIGRPGGARFGDELKLWLAGESVDFRTPAGSELPEYFEQHLQRFLRLRGSGAGPQDSIERLKRARESLGQHNGIRVLPSSVRMLAFFASNRAHLSCFDPTAGWQRLAGMEPADLPTDVQLHVAEVVGQIRKVRQGGQRNTPERALRWCSTAVHWFTEDAAEYLGPRLEPKSTLESFQRAMEPLQHLVQKIPSPNGGKPVYRADLALRVIVQDRWVQGDSLERAAVHHQIAQRLQALSHNKEMLPVEYPMRPHWGRSRMHWLSESLRHLMRSCEHAPRTLLPASARLEPPPVLLGPRGADGNWRPGYAQEVLDHCFGQLFWQQLNANQAAGRVHNRKLARQHGAYYLTAELLQLMSDGGRLGNPHWALDPALTGRYLREVAYAQLDLGDLHGARTSFEKLIAHWRSQGTEPADGIDFHLDLVLAQSALNELDAARVTLEMARRDFEALPSEGGDTVVRRNRLTTRTRLDARQAQLEYLSGKPEEALAILERIKATNPRAIARDVAHTYIATLGALAARDTLGGRERLHQAMALCIQNLFDNTSPGLHHGALGFRVSLGHLFRKLDMLDVAEVTLDQVCRDVQLYGCSERTYLAILLEAGRIVLAQGRPARAYAAYLRPCLDRARSCGHQRKARAALFYARQCIEQLLTAQASGLPQSRDRLAAELKGRGEPTEQDRGQSEGDGSTAAGTHFSPDAWIKRLGDRPQLQAELDQLV